MHLNPYLMFEGRTEEALAFYEKTLGAKTVALMRFKENPSPEHIPPGGENKVMHSEFRIGDAVLMASDGTCGGKPNFGGISLALSVNTPAEAEKAFNALSDGGQVQMPLTETFFSSRFGMVADKFGVSWMIVVSQPQ